MDVDHLTYFDLSLGTVPKAELNDWYMKGEGFFGPSLIERVCVQGRSGKTCEVCMIAVYESPATIAAVIRSRKKSEILARVQQAVDMANDLGCQVAGLGGLTSIIAANGTAVDSRGMTLTTGNSLTAAMTVAALEKAMLMKGLDPRKSSIGIVGGSGNIGKAYSLWAAGQFHELHLFGSATSRLRSESLVRWMNEQGAKVDYSTDLAALQSCDVIVTMTNEADAIIHPRYLSQKVKVILDVAVPRDVDPLVRVVFPNLLVIEGGWVKVPGLRTHLIAGMDAPPGHTLACMAETIVMGLAGRSEHFSYSELQERKIKEIYQLALREGFEPGDFRVPLPSKPPARHLDDRRRESGPPF